jgi:hypothetical protein
MWRRSCSVPNTTTSRLTTRSPVFIRFRCAAREGEESSGESTLRGSCGAERGRCSHRRPAHLGCAAELCRNRGRRRAQARGRRRRLRSVESLPPPRTAPLGTARIQRTVPTVRGSRHWQRPLSSFIALFDWPKLLIPCRWSGPARSADNVHPEPRQRAGGTGLDFRQFSPSCRATGQSWTLCGRSRSVGFRSAAQCHQRRAVASYNSALGPAPYEYQEPQ